MLGTRFMQAVPPYRIQEPDHDPEQNMSRDHHAYSCLSFADSSLQAQGVSGNRENNTAQMLGVTASSQAPTIHLADYRVREVN